jgi:hypothetical protein
MEGETKIEQTQNELTTIRGTEPGGNGQPGQSGTVPVGLTAFRKGFTGGTRIRPTNPSVQPSGKDHAENEANGTGRTSSSDVASDIVTGHFDREDQSNPLNATKSPGHIDSNGNAQVRSTGLSGKPEEPGRTGRRRGNKNNNTTDTGNNGDNSQTDSLGFNISVENPAITEDAPAEAEPVKEKRARVRTPKNPPKTKVDDVAQSLQDVYELVDMGINALITSQGKGEMYPEGLFRLDDDVAHRLSFNLVKLNDSMPKIAQKFQTVSTPLMLMGTFATDLFTKGMILNGILKTPKVNS